MQKIHKKMCCILIAIIVVLAAILPLFLNSQPASGPLAAETFSEATEFAEGVALIDTSGAYLDFSVVNEGGHIYLSILMHSSSNGKITGIQDVSLQATNPWGSTFNFPGADNGYAQIEVGIDDVATTFDLNKILDRSNGNWVFAIQFRYSLENYNGLLSVTQDTTYNHTFSYQPLREYSFEMNIVEENDAVFVDLEFLFLFEEWEVLRLFFERISNASMYAFCTTPTGEIKAIDVWEFGGSKTSEYLEYAGVNNVYRVEIRDVLDVPGKYVFSYGTVFNLDGETIPLFKTVEYTVADPTILEPEPPTPGEPEPQPEPTPEPEIELPAAEPTTNAFIEFLNTPEGQAVIFTVAGIAGIAGILLIVFILKKIFGRG